MWTFIFNLGAWHTSKFAGSHTDKDKNEDKMLFAKYKYNFIGSTRGETVIVV